MLSMPWSTAPTAFAGPGVAVRPYADCAAARPDLVEPATTARELSAMGSLPDAARSAFATIAGRVESSLFALRALGAEDWQAARAAYADFALARLAERR